VNNAGIGIGGAIADAETKKLDLQLAVNLRAVYLMTRECIPMLKEAGGEHGKALIVNTASIAGKHGQGWLAAYSATKFGVVGLTQAMAFELAPHGILVNCVCPGFVATPMQDRELEWEAAIRGITPEEVKRLWVADTPLGRIEEPEDVARVVAFLAGPDAGFMTGEAVAVNGGAFMD
jgi:NAD(P)-dependent dehydrogenase (short-subunit alcohol dehydrogenase family)